MKNLETLEAIRNASLTAYFILQQQLVHFSDQLDYCVNHEIINGDGKPNNSVQQLIGEIGKNNAEVIIATLINTLAWDGRISRENARWAANCEEAFDEAAAQKMRVHTAIHPTHLNAIASAFQKI